MCAFTRCTSSGLWISRFILKPSFQDYIDGPLYAGAAARVTPGRRAVLGTKGAEQTAAKDGMGLAANRYRSGRAWDHDRAKHHAPAGGKNSARNNPRWSAKERNAI